MLDVRANTIIYQAQVYYTNLVNGLVKTKSLGKNRLADWRKADLILGYLQTWSIEPRLILPQDITNYNYILYALITLCGINSFPVATPLVAQAAPTLQAGPKGDTGASIQGPRGFTGLATDFAANNLAVSGQVADTFPLNQAIAARWDYVVFDNLGDQRAGTVIAQWTPTGSIVTFSETSTDDIVGSTLPFSPSINIAAGNVQLIANFTSGGPWSISGSRYFIPNNGAGTGPVSGVLANGKIYVGNASGVATAVTPSGAATISNTGVVSLNPNIAVNLLQPLPANLVVVTDPYGFLSTSTLPATQLTYLTSVTQDLQTQINNVYSTVIFNSSTTGGSVYDYGGSF